MINNKDSSNNNTLQNVFIVLFSVVVLIGIICFCVFAYFRWFKGKNKYVDYYNVQHVIMTEKSLKIKNESMFHPDDMIQLNNFDCQLLKINKRENRENNNIYYISYKINKPEHDIDSINNLYFVVDHLYGKIEKINDSKDRYLVINKDSLMNEKNISFFYLWDSIINRIKYLRGDDVLFDDNEVIIKDSNKIRFSSDVFIPNDVSINFYCLVIIINYVIEKNDEFIPEIYINDGYFTKV